MNKLCWHHCIVLFASSQSPTLQESTGIDRGDVAPARKRPIDSGHTIPQPIICCLGSLAHTLSTRSRRPADAARNACRAFGICNVCSTPASQPTGPSPFCGFGRETINDRPVPRGAPPNSVWCILSHGHFLSHVYHVSSSGCRRFCPGRDPTTLVLSTCSWARALDRLTMFAPSSRCPVLLIKQFPS